MQHYLSNIQKNQKLNAFTEVYESEALAQASLVQQKIDNGTAGRLAGMVIAIKDVFCHQGHSLQSSSKILEGFKSQYTATSIQRLIDEDAIIIGRNNCDEFAMGSSNENSVFGPVYNAVGENRVPGGSSGGSAVAVQADMCLASIGSDTGGSVRQPASFCGVYGLKPTYGRISRYGLTAYASSFDCVGVFSRSVEDAQLMLEIMAGPDDYDNTASQTGVTEYSKSDLSFDKINIAVFDNINSHEALAVSVSENIKSAISAIKSEGHDVDNLDFDLLDYVLPTYYILTTAEASTNLSRFDGAKYGHRSDHSVDLDSLYKKSRSEGFGKEVKERILLGTYVLSEGYYDAYFTKAQKARRLIKEQMQSIFKSHDFIIMPTAPTPAFELNSHDRDPIQMYLEDIFTVQASLAGLPAISIPNGTDSEGLPIGLQVIANSFEEEKLLAFANYLKENVL